MPLAYSFGSPMQEARLGSAAALGGPHSPLARATPGVARLKASADAPIMSVVFTTYLLLSQRRGIQSQPMGRSEEHTSELQSLMRISYAVFCLKKKKKHIHNKI